MKTIRLRLLFIKKLSTKYNVLPHIKDGQNHIEQEEIITKIMVEPNIGLKHLNLQNLQENTTQKG